MRFFAMALAAVVCWGASVAPVEVKANDGPQLTVSAPESARPARENYGKPVGGGRRGGGRGCGGGC